MTDRFTYVVKSIDKTKDGDTTNLSFTVTPDLVWSVVTRLSGYDTPESKRTRCPVCKLYASPYELRMSDLALQWTREFIFGPGDLWGRVEMQTDSFGRQLTTLWHEVGDIHTSLGEALLDAGLASRWPTRWHELYDLFRDRA